MAKGMFQHENPLGSCSLLPCLHSKGQPWKPNEQASWLDFRLQGVQLWYTTPIISRKINVVTRLTMSGGLALEKPLPEELQPMQLHPASSHLALTQGCCQFLFLYSSTSVIYPTNINKVVFLKCNLLSWPYMNVHVQDPTSFVHMTRLRSFPDPLVHYALCKLRHSAKSERFFGLLAV